MAAIIGGKIRQRYSPDYPSDEDSEDDLSFKQCYPRMTEKPTAWTRIQDLLWIVSAIFIIYLGDRRSNLIHVLLFDNRIRRVPFNLGVFFILLNGIFAVNSKFPHKLASWVALLGLLSFSMISFSLWPIWSFSSIPLLISLLMTCMVVGSYLPVLGVASERGPLMGPYNGGRDVQENSLQCQP